MITWEQELRALHKQGLNDAEIAARVGKHQSTVTRARNRLGLKRACFGRPATVKPLAVKNLTAAGFSAEKIAAMLQAAPRTIYKVKADLKKGAE